nr:HNH endonuclease signature motif containing protein [Nocardioides sp. Iso805N]
MPATWCDAHHENPWSQGGPTDLTNAALLCGHHHRRAHDPTYETIRLANGDYRYRRKTVSRSRAATSDVVVSLLAAEVDAKALAHPDPRRDTTRLMWTTASG